MSMDFDEFLKLRQEVSNMVTDSYKFNAKFLEYMGQRLLAKVKPRTPVDTGALRNTWQIQGAFKGEKDTLYIVLFNPTEYASFVEFGHMTNGRKNWVNGYFMATVSVAEIEKEIPKRYEAELKAFLSGKNKYIKFN